MQSIQRHLQIGTAKQLGNCPAVLWSNFAMSSYDRTPEIMTGVREGWDG
jgi:hypothetical protein